MPNAIEVKNLSKKFVHYPSQVDRFIDLATGGSVKRGTDFWALKDISFEVPQGTTFGIIGQNGSGKSTLLSILAGVLQSTSGKFNVNGKVAAILELGSGFHHEFTGRENIYMYGAILGLSRVDISRRFEKIIDFSELHEFIDRPLYTYSSGMIMRLAFAVVINVDADILIVDEALAVGDIFFVQKCMRFLRRFQKSGTIVLVSHDASLVQSICESALLLENGIIQEIGSAKHVAEKYLQSISRRISELEEGAIDFTPIDRLDECETNLSVEKRDEETKILFFDGISSSEGWKTGKIEIQKISIMKHDGTPIESCQGGEKVSLVIRAQAHSKLTSPIIGFFIKDRLGQSLFGDHTFDYVDQPLNLLPNQLVEASFSFTLPMLPNGEYSITVSVAEGNPDACIQHHWIHDALIMNVFSKKMRYGLVGIPFESVSLRLTS